MFNEETPDQKQYKLSQLEDNINKLILDKYNKDSAFIFDTRENALYKSGQVIAVYDELPEMIDYLDMLEKKLNIKIDRYKNKKTTWDSWFYGKWISGKFAGKIRGFPFVIGAGCWAKRELKLKQIEKAQGKNNVIYIGIAKDEKHRTLSKCYSNKKNKYKFPLIDWGWSELDCLQYLKSKNLLNPLYKKFKRTGCWCCPKQNKQSLQILFQEYPVLWNRLKQYEKDSPQGFHPEYKLKELEQEFKNKSLIINNNFSQTTLTIY